MGAEIAHSTRVDKQKPLENYQNQPFTLVSLWFSVTHTKKRTALVIAAWHGNKVMVSQQNAISLLQVHSDHELIYTNRIKSNAMSLNRKERTLSQWSVKATFRKWSLLSASFPISLAQKSARHSGIYLFNPQYRGHAYDLSR